MLWLKVCKGWRMPPARAHAKLCSACFDIALRRSETYTARQCNRRSVCVRQVPSFCTGASAMMRHPLRLWQRLSTRMVAAFVLVTLFAIGLAVFVMIYGLAHVPLLGRLEAVRDVQGLSRLLEEVVSAKLLNLTRVGVLLIDPLAQAEAQRTPGPDFEAQQRVRTALVSIQKAGELTTPVYTLTDYDPATQRARVVVVSDADESLQAGALLPVGSEAAEVLGWTFE